MHRMIVIPSFSIADLSSPAALLDLLAEWTWFGFPKLELALAERPGTRLDHRSLQLVCREASTSLRVDVDVPDIDQMTDLIEAGASSIVLGARALDDPDWLHEAAEALPGVLAVKLPARERRLRTRGAVRVVPVDLAD